MASITWKKAYTGSLVVHLLLFGVLTLFMAGTVAQHEEEKMYVVDLDTSDLMDSGSGHAGGGGGGGSTDLSSLFPEKLSAEAVAERTAQIEQSSSALTSPNTAMEPIPDAAPESLAAAPSAASSSSSAAGSSGASTSSSTSGGSGGGSGTGDGTGDGQGYGEGSGEGQGSGDSGSSGTGRGAFDTDGFWAAVNANKTYPTMAIKRGLTGTVNVTVTLDANGNCVGASASGDGMLAQAAVNAVYAACPYPNPTGASVTINVPVTFELQ